ncbi:MAG: hypothetical protein NTY45_13820 [Elusimicrobia bacterium]|nr:hypothetical protein [Elusimicrobiota bacterium]
MDLKENGVLGRLATLSLERCLVKLSKVSAGTWQLVDTECSTGTLADAILQYDFKNRSAAGVSIEVKGAFSFATLMLFDPEEMDCISKCFLGYSFPRTKSVSQSDEMMLLELGNIILNALTNSVMNALGTGFIPSVPRYVAGDSRGIEEGLGGVMDLKRDFRTVQVTLAMRSGENVSRCKVFAFLPEELARELAGMVS